MVRRGNDRTSERAVDVLRRGEPARVLAELGCGRDRTSRARRSCRLVESVGNRSARPVDGEGQVAPAAFRLIHSLCQQPMKLATACSRHA